MSPSFYLDMELIVTLSDLHQLLLHEFAWALRGLQPTADLLHLRLEQAEAALLQAILLPQLIVMTGILVHLHLHILAVTEGYKTYQEKINLVVMVRLSLSVT